MPGIGPAGGRGAARLCAAAEPQVLALEGDPESVHDPVAIKHPGVSYLFSTGFRQPNSAIGLAANQTLDPHSPDYEWTGEGKVRRS